MAHMHREKLGVQFSEGARLLWVALEERGQKPADVARELETDTGSTSRLLYGDQRPGRTLSARIRDVYGIDPASWDETPKKAFAPPAARKKPTPTKPKKRPRRGGGRAAA